VQDEVNQEYSEQNEVDGMKKGAKQVPFKPYAYNGIVEKLQKSFKP